MHPTIKKIIGYFRNKYFTVTIIFLAWICFFDRNDLISEAKLMYKINKLRTERTYFQQQTDLANDDLKELQTDPASLEKFAREKYLMKKDNEDVYVITDKNSRLLDTLKVSPH